ncbi:hypothetical protein MKX03_013200, partial [Papaver bracteatum]
MKVPSPKTPRRSFMHEYTPTTQAVGESSTHHQDKGEEAGQERQQEKQECEQHQQQQRDQQSLNMKHMAPTWPTPTTETTAARESNPTSTT